MKRFLSTLIVLTSLILLSGCDEGFKGPRGCPTGGKAVAVPDSQIPFALTGACIFSILAFRRITRNNQQNNG